MLWQGKWKSLYNSQSEADLALCNMIAFHATDKAQVDSLFRQSVLYRDKWERTDYRTETINKAWESAKQARKEQKEQQADTPYFYKSKFLPTAMMDCLETEFSFLAFKHENEIRFYRDWKD